MNGVTMSAEKVEVLVEEDEFDIPLDISDILAICKEYQKVGYQVQNQIDSILELGVEEAIATGAVKESSLIFISDFLSKIIQNPYFGDATFQARTCSWLIKDYQFLNQPKPIVLN